MTGRPQGMHGMSSCCLCACVEVAAGPPDELQIIRLRSKKHEVMLAPSPSGKQEYLVIVIQNPVVE